MTTMNNPEPMTELIEGLKAAIDKHMKWHMQAARRIDQLQAAIVRLESSRPEPEGRDDPGRPKRFSILRSTRGPLGVWDNCAAVLVVEACVKWGTPATELPLNKALRSFTETLEREMNA